MNASHLIASFFAGLFLANAVPHYVYGICGNRFPTPFAKPPGRGLSSPLVNVLWGLLNCVVGTVLFRKAHLANGDGLSLAVFFTGLTLISVVMAPHFAKKHAE